MGGDVSVSVTEGDPVCRFQTVEKWKEETCGMGGRGLKMSLQLASCDEGMRWGWMT